MSLTLVPPVLMMAYEPAGLCHCHMWSEAPACLFYECATALSTEMGDHNIAKALQLLLGRARQYI